MRRVLPGLWLVVLLAVPASAQPAQPARPVVGVAFGGGSARGIAHIGVLAWLAEHRVPVDVAAGTSMGGLIGGSWATGMPPDELKALIAGIDWDLMFGSSSFAFKNVRRKDDARAYPSRLEFGLKRGLVPPTALNDGQQVDLLIARITAPYYGIAHFDDLPTPFRTVAVDLRTAEKVVLESGSLFQALRATMSLPGVFPPVEAGQRVLVDGGALDNVPADVVRAMGATYVIAIDVGTEQGDAVNQSLFALMGQTVDAMMRANTRRALEAADLTLKVDVSGFGSLDWRRNSELVERGYAAAERLRADLLKLAVSEEEYAAWVARRQSRRRTALPSFSRIEIDGLTPADARYAQQLLGPEVGQPVDVARLEKAIAPLAGLDRYQGVSWAIAGEAGNEALIVRARPKPYAPPFLMLGVNLENTTSDDFRAQLAARYLAFDVLGSGSELRVDVGVGSDPSLGASLYRPLFRGGALFGRASAGIAKRTFDFIADEVVIAQYAERRMAVGLEAGTNLSRDSEVSGGFVFSDVDTEVRAGDPGLPELDGGETQARVRWVFDSQDSATVPSRGQRVRAELHHFMKSPQIAGFERTNEGVTQAELIVSSFWRWRETNRLFAIFAGGTSFDGKPLPTNQFTLGRPFMLDAYDIGERRGDHMAVATVGYLHRLGRLPDFLGGPVFGGVWLQNGAAFNTNDDADLHTQAGVGVIFDTLMGPVLVGTSAGFDGGWRWFFGIGRLIR